jgi:hypothetical protein
MRQGKAPVREHVERGPAGFCRAFAVDLRAWRLGKWCPEATRCNGFDSALDGCAVSLEKRMRHETALFDSVMRLL